METVANLPCGIMIEYEIAKRMIIGDIHIDKRGI